MNLSLANCGFFKCCIREIILSPPRYKPVLFIAPIIAQSVTFIFSFRICQEICDSILSAYLQICKHVLTWIIVLFWGGERGRERNAQWRTSCKAGVKWKQNQVAYFFLTFIPFSQGCWRVFRPRSEFESLALSPKSLTLESFAPHIHTPKAMHSGLSSKD